MNKPKTKREIALAKCKHESGLIAFAMHESIDHEPRTDMALLYYALYGIANSICHLAEALGAETK